MGKYVFATIVGAVAGTMRFIGRQASMVKESSEVADQIMKALSELKVSDEKRKEITEECIEFVDKLERFSELNANVDSKGNEIPVGKCIVDAIIQYRQEQALKTKKIIKRT